LLYLWKAIEVKKETESVYSVILELYPIKDVTIPISIGTKSHASFLNLIGQFNPALSARLHDEPRYRPYTVSPLYGGKILGERMALKRVQPCHLRVTLLDSGGIWSALQTYYQETRPIYMELGDADFRLIRMLIESGTGPTKWAGYADWQMLATIAAQSIITMNFSTATAFSLGERQFCLFPEPSLVWGSLLRTWNRYAPVRMYMEKQTIHESLGRHIAVTACKLHHAFLHFPTYVQKGFVGRCTYHLNADQQLAEHLTTLAAFAQYAGVGYKTTMGMGQVYVEFGKTPSNYPSPRVKHNYFL
jgi:CRISPR-associated endoribonuclease Cas6